jgi:hypothetical protein
MTQDALGHKILMEHMKLPRHFDLYLYISRDGHAFGSTVASLLKRCNGILTLTCIMHDKNARLSESHELTFIYVIDS